MRLSDVAGEEHLHSAADANNSARGIDIDGNGGVTGQRQSSGGAQNCRNV